MKTLRDEMNSKPHRGRPRSFDVDRALDRAMKVFWRKGYEGASLPDLTRAMGINRPSLYAAFGNKEMLFRRALQRYGEGPGGYVGRAMDEPTARRVVERLLYGGIDLLTNPRNPRGCFSVQGALACGDDAAAMRNELIAHREAGIKALRRRFERAKSEGDLPANANPAALARYIATVMHGLSVQATSGASRRELRSVAQLALKAWPNSRL